MKGEEMKIKGNGCSVNEIEMKLNSMNTRFQCFMDPFPYSERRDMSESNAAVIIFEDLSEIDSLIKPLVYFRDRNAMHIGVWK